MGRFSKTNKTNNLGPNVIESQVVVESGISTSRYGGVSKVSSSSTPVIREKITSSDITSGVSFDNYLLGYMLLS